MPKKKAAPKKKTKYLYATKMHIYIMLVTLVFISGIMGFAYFQGGADAPPVSVLGLTIGMIALIAWFTWKSYKGELPMMRIEER